MPSPTKATYAVTVTYLDDTPGETPVWRLLGIYPTKAAGYRAIRDRFGPPACWPDTQMEVN